MTDSGPFQLLTEVFQAEYRVNLSLERPDGSIVFTLFDERGIAARRLIRPAQLHGLEQSQWMTGSIHFGIVTKNGTSAPQLSQTMTQGKTRQPIAI